MSIMFESLFKSNKNSRPTITTGTRKKRSDAKKMVKINVDRTTKIYLHRMASFNGLTVSKLVAKLINNSLNVRNNEMYYGLVSEGRYPDHSFMVACKLNQDDVSHIGEMAAERLISIKKMAHLILMFELNNDRGGIN